MLLHEILGKRFRRFELGGFLVWTPNSQVAFLKKVRDSERERVDAAGFDGLVAKPISPATFAGEIAQLLG